MRGENLLPAIKKNNRARKISALGLKKTYESPTEKPPLPSPAVSGRNATCASTRRTELAGIRADGDNAQDLPSAKHQWFTLNAGSVHKAPTRPLTVAGAAQVRWPVDGHPPASR